jgi:hypothetical protein
MANNINPISINTQAIKYAQLSQPDKKDDAIKDASKEPKHTVGQKEVPASDVLSYMAAQSVDVQPKVKKTVDVSKYVTPEQAQRIAGFVQGFEKEVEKGLLNFDKEFPGNGLSDAAKLGIAAQIYDKDQG